MDYGTEWSTSPIDCALCVLVTTANHPATLLLLPAALVTVKLIREARGINDTTQHYTTQHYTPQHNTTQHNTTQHNTTQHNTTQHNTTQHDTTQHNTTQHNTTQHNTTQHNTTQHNTTQHNTTQHNTTQHNTLTTGTQQRTNHGLSTKICNISSLRVFRSTCCHPMPPDHRSTLLMTRSTFSPFLNVAAAAGS